MSDDNEASVEVLEKREAALVNLHAMLAGKKRGDRITAAEIVEATGFEDWRSFRGPIHRYVASASLVSVAVPNDGWRIGLPADHIDFAEKKRQSALRKERRGLKALVDTPIVELDDRQTRRAEFLTVRAAARVQSSQKDDKEIRKELKIGSERVPLRIATLETNNTEE
jgi:hypothetical protein